MLTAGRIACGLINPIRRRGQLMVNRHDILQGTRGVDLEPMTTPSLEIAAGTPDRAGVRAMLDVLERFSHKDRLSVGKVCGGRVSAVYLGDSLEVASLTLEAFELDDAHLAHSRAVHFIAELEQIA